MEEKRYQNKVKSKIELFRHLVFWKKLFAILTDHILKTFGDKVKGGVVNFVLFP